MAVTVTDPINGPYSPNGATTEFAFDFKIASPAEISVWRILDGVSTVVGPADYSVTIAVDGEGGTVTFNVAPAAGSGAIYISSDPLFTQKANFGAEGPFFPNSLNSPLDQAAIRDIYLKSEVRRAIRLPHGKSLELMPSQVDGVIGIDPAGSPRLFPKSSFAQGPRGPAGKLEAITPEDFASAKPSGVLGDGTDDGPALAAMSAELNARGGGTIWFEPGKTYWVGEQTFMDPPVSHTGSGSGPYRYWPTTPYPIFISGCTKPVHIFGNGAVIRGMDGLRYGSFDVNGNPIPDFPYFGEGIAIPYIAMVRIEHCSGGVYGDLPELDGNLKNAIIGGVWSSAGDGRQIAMSGIQIADNPGPVDVYADSHHHGLDGGIGNGLGDLDTKEQVIVRGRYENNGRQGFSLVGGNGWSFRDARFAGTGKDIGGMQVSAPGAGFDIEGEAGRWAINTTFHNCDFEDNAFAGMVSDASGYSREADFYNCRFIGTTSWSIFLTREAFRFHDCFFAGAMVGLHGNDDPYLATKFYRCTFSDDPAYSPTGQLYTQGAAVFMDLGLGSNNVYFEECTFLKTQTGDNLFGHISEALAGRGPKMHNCLVERKPGAPGVFRVGAVFTGRRTTLLGTSSVPKQIANPGLGAFEDGLFYDSVIHDGTRYPPSSTDDPDTGRWESLGVAIEALGNDEYLITKTADGEWDGAAWIPANDDFRLRVQLDQINRHVAVGADDTGGIAVNTGAFDAFLYFLNSGQYYAAKAGFDVEAGPEAYTTSAYYWFERVGSVGKIYVGGPNFEDAVLWHTFAVSLAASNFAKVHIHAQGASARVKYFPRIEGVNIPGKMAAQTDSVAVDVDGLKADFNALLAKLRATGRMSA